MVGEFNGWDRGACPLERARRRRVGRLRRRASGRARPYKYAITGADGRTIDRADPMAQFAEHSGGMASIVFESQHEWQDGEWMARRDDADPVARPHEHLRGAPRLVAPPRRRPRPLLPRAGARARRPRHRPRVHPRRADADRRAPLRAVVGLPGHRLLRAHLALRRPRRLPLVRRPPPPARPRRDRRLGARPLPARRRRPRPLRRHAALRVRRPAAGRAPRLGHPRVRPRQARGARLPHRQRPLLARRAARRRPARRRRRVDALPRLLADEGPVDARTCTAATRTSRRSRSSRR